MPPGRAVSAAASAVGESSLPVELTRLVGRRREVAELRRLLASERLVTLTGAGGSGKTRLALAVAAEAPGFDDGVRFADIAAVADPRLVAPHVAASCGLRDITAVAPEERLVTALESSSLLLVLDNCEHLVEACAQLVDRLLRNSRRLSVLATSREALGVAGEQAWLVPPLGLPPEDAELTIDAALAAPAVELFVERARAARPDLVLGDVDVAAVAQICRRLDGLPLALELAAARLKVLTPRDLARRLDDAFSLLTTGARTAPARHRTLRATLDWSCRLLAAPERAVLRRLSVFVGSFDLAAAEVVAVGEEVDRDDVLDLLAALVDRSLVQVEPCCEESRYRLLETVRQYAAERLTEAGERKAAESRHGRHFLSLAEQAEPAVCGEDGDARAKRCLDQEALELRAAFDHLVGDPEGPALALRLACSLHWYWLARGWVREAREQLAGGLEAAGDGVDPQLRARSLAALARVASWQGDGNGIQQTAMEAAPASELATVEVRALGGFEVWRDGELLDDEAWGASKPRDLLLFLLAHPAGVGRAQVGLALWPDASPAQLRNSFHVTLHRLRRALGGTERITARRDRYAVAPDLLDRFDGNRFASAGEAALSAVDAAEGDAADLVEQALALYRGDFLAGETLADWALGLRERFAVLHRRLLRARGDLLLAAGGVAEAAQAFSALLAIDDLDEDAARRLMACEARLHRRSAALRVYQSLSERLRSELAAEPDPATTALFERLQTGDPV